MLFLIPDTLLSVDESKKTLDDIFVILQLYFYPYDISLCGDGSTAANCVPQKTPYVITQSIWVVAYIISAQPYQLKLRFYGSTIGVLAFIAWTIMLIGVSFALGLRH